MKRAFRQMVWGIAGLANVAATAQNGGDGFPMLPSDSLRPTEWHIHYDSTLKHQLHLLPLPDTRPLIGNLKWQPLIPGSSIVRLEVQGLPTRIYVLNNITLQIGGYVNLTNGQAWIFGPYPASKLDARTLSLPLPR